MNVLFLAGLLGPWLALLAALFIRRYELQSYTGNGVSLYWTDQQKVLHVRAGRLGVRIVRNKYLVSASGFGPRWQWRAGLHDGWTWRHDQRIFERMMGPRAVDSR